MSIDLTPEMQAQLRNSANRAIWDAAWQSYPIAGPAGEVKFLKNLIEVGVPLIEAAWHGILDSIGINMRLTGHVCHGHPWVRFSNHATRCELGDFLIVHEHHSAAGALERRAVIVQAKIFYDNGGVSARNKLQLELYKNWPEFRYESWPGGIGNLAATLNKHGLLHGLADPFVRDMKQGGHPSNLPTSNYVVDTGCKYGLIDVDYAKSLWRTNYRKSPWRLCSPHVSPSVYLSKNGYKFGTFLTQMLRGQSGRPTMFTAWPKSIDKSCNWSLMVKELMTLGNQVLPSASSALKPLSAGVPSHLNEPDNNPENSGGSPREPDTYETEEPEGGFGIALLQTSDGSESLPQPFQDDE